MTTPLKPPAFQFPFWNSALLVHEYLKEGYWFKLAELLKFPTHESIIVLAGLVGVILLYAGAKS